MLFALAMEPLAQCIRTDDIVSGWGLPSGRDDRIALYADDVLLCIAEPQTTGPRILEILVSFEKAKGPRVNKKKSFVVPLRGDRDDIAWSEGIPIK